MSETIEDRSSAGVSVPPSLSIPLQTLSCHQCMMLFDAQGFINFRTGFSAQNLTGEGLSYVETVEDIVEMKTDMLKIQMRRLFAKIQEWKTRGIHKDEFFPEEVAELIPIIEASIDVIKRPDQSAVKSSSTKQKQHFQEKQQPLASSAVIGVSTATTTTYKQRKGEKRKYEHALILSVADVSEGVQPNVNGSDDASDHEMDVSNPLQTISLKEMKQLLTTAEEASFISNHEPLLKQLK